MGLTITSIAGRPTTANAFWRAPMVMGDGSSIVAVIGVDGDCRDIEVEVDGVGRC